jgi:hypothetical protein
MYTTYHLNSALEINTDLLDAIKATYKSRPISIIVHEEENVSELSENKKAILDERLMEDEKNYLTSEETIEHLNKKYGL